MLFKGLQIIKEKGYARAIECLLNDMSLDVPIKKQKLRENAKELQYAHEGDSGFDLFTVSYTIIEKDGSKTELDSVILEPGQRVLGNTGWAVELPKNFEIQIRPTSGNSLKTKITVFLGTVDDCYRGELGIIIENSSNTYLELKSGQKIAQGVISFVPKAIFKDVDNLSETERGTNGYGSTGYVK